MKQLTTIEQALKDTASQAMTYAAAASGYVRALNDLAQSGVMSDEKFLQVAGMCPSTLARAIELASDDFQNAKDTYECVCRELKVPSYATYNED